MRKQNTDEDYKNNGIRVGDDWDRPIYRIFKIEHFKEMMKTNRLTLVSPKKWDDPFENFFLKNGAIDPETGELLSLEEIYKEWYGLCWTTDSDTDAMWRIYSEEIKTYSFSDDSSEVLVYRSGIYQGVRLRTTISKLFHAIYQKMVDPKRHCFIGKVEYKSKEKIEQIIRRFSFIEATAGGQNDGLAKMLCIKRPEFKHENEIRLLVEADDPNINRDSSDIIRIDFDHAAVIDEVCLDPRLSKEKYQETRESLIQAGCSIDIIQSDLYKITPTPITLW